MKQEEVEKKVDELMSITQESDAGKYATLVLSSYEADRGKVGFAVAMSSSELNLIALILHAMLIDDTIGKAILMAAEAYGTEKMEHIFGLVAPWNGNTGN